MTTIRPNGTVARGYGIAHKRQRAAWSPLVAAGAVRCARCRQPIKPGAPWDLGHADHPDAKQLGLYRGPEHRRCSRAKVPVQPLQPAPALRFFKTPNQQTRP